MLKNFINSSGGKFLYCFWKRRREKNLWTHQVEERKEKNFLPLKSKWNLLIEKLPEWNYPDRKEAWDLHRNIKLHIMPKCLMAKKWKAYPWPDRNETIEVEDEEEIDVVGDSPANKQGTATCWGPSSPTAGATAPSPPPHSPKGSTILYNGESEKFSLISH